MLELQLQSNAGQDAPVYNYLKYEWMQSGETRTNEYYLYNDIHYTSDDSFENESYKASTDIAHLYLYVEALNDLAQDLINEKKIKIKHDILKDTVATNNSASWSNISRYGYSSFVDPSSPLFIGDLPMGYPTSGGSLDTTKALRFAISIENPNTEETSGQALWQIYASNALGTGYENDLPIYDACLYDAIVPRKPDTIDYGGAQLSSALILEAFLFDSELENVYNSYGFNFGG